ncbi:hypothetical protein [Herbaspirillum frisingense]|uniref:hypothetical protein n=1 Tax=Herbaspirillum frisingense TaxID=92645 RepID=UPI001F3A47E8|nr:hypothetical protein [Herbaspirillum frisingense]
MKRIGTTLFAAASLLLAACTANEDGKAKELVTEFYQAHASARPVGALTLQELITFRSFLSVSLFDLLKDVSVAQEARTAQAAADLAADPDAEPLPPWYRATCSPATRMGPRPSGWFSAKPRNVKRPARWN